MKKQTMIDEKAEMKMPDEKEKMIDLKEEKENG
jgi:hypothetical protein